MDKKHIEALLFVAKEPLKIEDIVKIVKETDESMDETIVLRWMFELQNEYTERGIHIRQVAGGFEMVTADECFDTIEKLLPKQYDRLSRSAFETLAAIVVKGPAIRATISKFRGVKNPDDAIQKLLERNLIKHTEEGYVTTDVFLKEFGINDLKELKELKKELELLDKNPEVSEESDEEVTEEVTEKEDTQDEHRE